MKNFDNFIKFASSQKEVSLIVAKSQHELEVIAKQLEGAGFEKFVETKKLTEKIKDCQFLFLEVKKEDLKASYDFAVQYPTGQVEIFDQEKMENSVSNIDYQNRAVVLLLTEEILKGMQENHFDILSKIGLTYRNEDK